MENKITKDTKKKPVLNPKGGKTVTGKPADTIDISPQIEKQVNEQSRGGVVLAFGRMNPPTVGHEKLANKILAVAKQYGAKPMLFLSHSQDKKKNPLDYADKIRFAKKSFGAMVQSSPAKTLIDVAKLVQVHYKDLYVIAGADRVTEFETLLNKYNGKEFNFDSIKVVSAGERDPDSDSVEGMSASKMREAVKNNNFAAFKGGLPARLRSSAKEVFDLTKLGMQLAEELEAEGLDLIESLSVDQRRKRAMILRRNETKIQRAKELAKKRLASSDQLKKRAINKARDIIRRKLAGGKDYHTLTTAEKITIDKRMEKRKSAVNKLAKRIMNKVKTAEYERLKSYVAGQKELPAPTNEAFNRAFAEHAASSIPAVDTDSIIAEMIQLVLDKSITEKETQSLHNKASKSGIAYALIEQVFIRGLLDSMGDHAAAFNRVNAFIAGGKTAMNEDHDLYQKANPTDVNAIFEAKMKDEDPCWKDYKMVGMKKKGGKEVPNCVPKEAAVKEDINAEFLAKLADALNGTPGQAAPSTGTKEREDIENVSRGDDEERKEVVNVQRKKSKTTSIAKQASIKHGLDESFKIATAAGYSQFLTAADCGIKMQGGFAFHPSVLPPEDEEEADDDHV
jgi:nicotinic acid mononucleotide adenylyltransferase